MRNHERVDIAPLERKSLLVTGAAGYIGGVLFRYLADSGLKVLGTVLEAREAEALRLAGYNAAVLNLADDGSWDSLLEGVDVVFHIAAMFQEYEGSRALYQKVNCDGALKLAQTAARQGVSRFVHCSTVGVHGAVKEIPCRETSPFNPMDIYHETKLAGELAVLDFARSLPADGMVVAVNRPAMVYGPGDTRMMLKLFQMIDSGRFRMIGSGEVLAHLGYIDDQVDSFILCATAPSDQVHGEAFNIASDRPCTLNELVNSIGETLGVAVSKQSVPVWPVWMAAWLCEIVCKPLGVRPPLFRRRVGFFTHNRSFDLTKAQERLGYVSRWKLADGIAETAKWYKSRSEPEKPPSPSLGGSPAATVAR
jgi:nucleoside-diphosphate-sugar epimerase